MLDASNLIPHKNPTPKKGDDIVQILRKLKKYLRHPAPPPTTKGTNVPFVFYNVQILVLKILLNYYHPCHFLKD